MGKHHTALSKEMFSQLLSDVWAEAMHPENIKIGFKSTVLYPPDRSKFPEHLYDPIELAQYKKRLEGELCSESASI